MCIRTANGRFLACCSFLVVIMFGLVTEAFAQREMGPPQPSGGEGRNVILPPGDGNGNSGGNPGGFPWWLQPNGNIPIPGSGIGNPHGGNDGSGRGGGPATSIYQENCPCEADGAPEPVNSSPFGDWEGKCNPTKGFEMVVRKRMVGIRYMYLPSRPAANQVCTQGALCPNKAWIYTKLRIIRFVDCPNVFKTDPSFFAEHLDNTNALATNIAVPCGKGFGSDCP